MLCEFLRIKRCRGQDDSQVWSLIKESPQITQQKIDVERTFMGFVDDQRVVVIKKTVALGFCEQDTVRHQFDEGVWGRLIGKPYFEAYG